MKNRLRYICIAILSAALLQSCGNDGGEDNPGYDIPAPKLILSNPIPCLEEEVIMYYETDLSASPKWDLGDGTTSTDAMVRHYYAQEGKYTVTLEISDGKGGYAKTDTVVEVAGKSLNRELAKLMADPGKVWACAHRGHTYDGKHVSNIPENSIESILKAWEEGAEIVEIDVRQTSDGVFVLMHDLTVNRTTNGNGQVTGKTLAEVKQLRLKAENGTLTDCTVPTLEEALLAGRGKIFFNLDLAGRERDLRRIVQLVESLHMLDRVALYTAGDKDLASEAVSTHKDAIIFPWVSSAGDCNYWSSYKRTSMVQMGYGASTGTVAAAAAAKGMASYTNSLGDVDTKMLSGDYSDIDNMIGLGINIIQTDYVEVLKGHLNK